MRSDIGVRFRSFVSVVIHRRRFEDDMAIELQFHRDARVEELTRAGVPHDQAVRRALIEFGGVEGLKEEARQARGLRFVDQLRQDSLYAVRSLRRSPIFLFGAVASLSLGIGANIALFGLVDALLLRSLPIPRAAELVTITRPNAAGKFVPIDAATLDLLNADTTMFAGATISEALPQAVLTIDGVNEPDRAIVRVTSTFFRVLGLTPRFGQPDMPGRVAILSDRYWRSRFESSTSVIGRSLTIDRREYRIVGVAPPTFVGVSFDAAVDAWVTAPEVPIVAHQAFARLQPGTGLAAAASSTEQLLRALPPSNSQAGPDLSPKVAVEPAGQGSSLLRDVYRVPLLALMGLVVVVLLLTCTNVANLFALRYAGRTHELTLRAALGAGRARLVVQLLVEGVLLASVSACGAWMVAGWGTSVLLATLPIRSIPEQLRFHTDMRMLSALCLLALSSAVAFTILPALRATRVELTTVLRASRGATSGHRSVRGAHALVVAQVALAVVLLAGAGLFARTVRNVAHFNAGFDSHNLVQVELTRDGPDSPQAVRDLEEDLLNSVAAIPGVQSVTALNAPVFPARFVGMTQPPGAFGGWVGPHFFETMRIPLVRGRLFSDSDVTRAQAAAVVNEAYEKDILEGDAIGKRIQNGPFNLEVVGVVRNARLHNIRWDVPQLYRVGLRESGMMSALFVRTSGDAGGTVAAIERTVRNIAPRFLLSVQMTETVMLNSISRERMVAATSGGFAALGLLLSAVGIFGVAALAVSERTHELGVRIAMGANPTDVVWASLRNAIRLVCVGLACGGIASAVLARLASSHIANLLFGLNAVDWTNMTVAVVLMAVIAIVACVIPAIRASQVDALETIRRA